MIRRQALADLTEAIEWLREHWSERDIPNRLHERDFDEGGAPRYTPAFARYLDARPDDTAQITSSRSCAHLRLRKASIWDCPDCAGTGTFETSSVAYRYPTWRAMAALRTSNLRAHDRVLTLVINAFDITDACQVLHCREGHLLDSIRALYMRYERAPSTGRRVGWVTKSESQRNAEGMQMMVAVT